MMEFQIENQLNVTQLAILGINGVQVVANNKELWQEVELLTNSLGEQYTEEQVNQTQMIKEVRELFKLEGMDPLRYRPSSEALLRRIIKGKGLYKINSVVDVNNWCSLEFLLPMGLYDADHIKGNKLTFRHGKAGESYEGIDKGIQNAEGKIIMVDESKICGGPVSDSVQTMITLNTKNLVVVIYAPKETNHDELEKITEVFAQRMKRYNGGTVGFTRLV